MKGLKIECKYLDIDIVKKRHDIMLFFIKKVGISSKILYYY